MNADELSDRKRRAMTPLRWERVRRGLTMREAADGAGISSHSLLAHWESGELSPSAGHRTRIAEFYGCTEESLFGTRREVKASRPEPKQRAPRVQQLMKPPRQIMARAAVGLPGDAPPQRSLLREKLAARMSEQP